MPRARSKACNQPCGRYTLIYFANCARGCGLSVFILHPPPVCALELGQRTAQCSACNCACGAQWSLHRNIFIILIDTVYCVQCSFRRIAALHYVAIISHHSRQLLWYTSAALFLLSHFWKTNPLRHTRKLFHSRENFLVPAMQKWNLRGVLYICFS